MKTIINGKEYECRFLNSWDYNSALIFDALEKIVLDNGGTIVSRWENTCKKTLAITNRSLSSAIREKEDFAKKLETFGRPISSKLQSEIEHLKAIPNDPVLSLYGDWKHIRFVLDDICYYYDMDRNPFFEFHYCKSPVVNNSIDTNAYHHEDKKDWLYDCFFRYDCSRSDRVEAAHMIFNMLINAPVSKTARPARIAKLHTMERGC